MLFKSCLVLNFQFEEKKKFAKELNEILIFDDFSRRAEEFAVTQISIAKKKTFEHSG